MKNWFLKMAVLLLLTFGPILSLTSFFKQKKINYHVW